MMLISHDLRLCKIIDFNFLKQRQGEWLQGEERKSLLFDN